MRLYNEALLKNAHLADAWNNLGVSYRKIGPKAAAIPCYRRALALRPEHPDTWINFGNVLRDLGQLNEAINAHKTALTYNNAAAGAWYGLALCHRDQKSFDDALDCLNTAISIDPDNAEYLWDKSLICLQTKDYKTGFQLYETRFQLDRFVIKTPETPRWDGRPLGQQRLLLCSEQGFGDLLQYCRFLAYLTPDIRQNGTIFLEVRPELVQIIQHSFPDIQIISRDTPPPSHDIHFPIMSLPAIFGTASAQHIPKAPYISAPKTGPFIPPPLKHTELRVGLTWGGSPTHSNDHNRSFALSDLAPILQIPNISFYALQKGARAEELHQHNLHGLIADMAPHMTSFADTAFILRQLDVVISADTSIVHLAGAMGCPCWVAISQFQDWRFGKHEDIADWYSAVRPYQQTQLGNWQNVMERIADDLQAAMDIKAGRT
jgi:hypothetical protein